MHDNSSYRMLLSAPTIVRRIRYCDQCHDVCACVHVGGCIGVWVCTSDRNELKLGTGTLGRSLLILGSKVKGKCHG